MLLCLINMTVLAKATDITKAGTDLVAVFVWQGKKEKEMVWSEEAKKVDAAMDGIILLQ